MDEKAVKKLNRQLRAIKSMLFFFSILMVVSLVILGFLAWKVLTFTNDVNNKIDSFQQTTEQNLNFKNQLCNDDTVGSFLKQSSDVCR
jgi:hypothetical protein